MSLASLGNAVAELNSTKAMIEGGKYAEAVEQLNSASASFDAMQNEKTVQLQNRINELNLAELSPNVKPRIKQKLFVPGDPNSFYLVSFFMASEGVTTPVDITIFRADADDGGVNGNPAVPGGAMVSLVGMGYGLAGWHSYLSTLSNVQTVRQTVANASLKAFCNPRKRNPNGPSTVWNSAAQGYECGVRSAVMLRGNLNYEISMSDNLNFRVHADNEVIDYIEADFYNVEWVTSSMPEHDARLASGGPGNDVGTSFNFFGV